jgi:dUTP pyrophosphatase
MPSSVALNYGLIIGAGIIDSDYTGQIYVLLINPTPQHVRIDVGAKIAQMVIVPYHNGTCVTGNDQARICIPAYNSVYRGNHGFGSGDQEEAAPMNPNRRLFEEYIEIQNCERRD